MSALDDIRQRAEAATEGPWEARIGAYSSEGGTYSGGYIPEVCEQGHDEDGYYAPLTEEDAEFIAHARADIPRLLRALDAALALHKPEKRWEPYEGAGFSYETQAEALEALGDVDVNQVVLEGIAANGAPYFEVCAECGRMEAEQLQESMGEWCYRESIWPCRTVAAVNDALEGK